MANGSYSGESPDPYGSAAEVRFAAHETFAQGEPDDNQHAASVPMPEAPPARAPLRGK